MRLWPTEPEPDDPWARHGAASETEREAIERASCQSRYDYEHDLGFFSKYFPGVDTTQFRGRRLLDLGCFTGGRLVYWTHRYGFKDSRGIDIDPMFARAGNRFAALKGADAAFDTGFAESLPYPDASFDFIASYDVLEHVRNVGQALRECHRVLKPGGVLLCVFPPFYQPLESHLGMASGWPALHWIFPLRELTAAYYEILQERGPSAAWYARKSPELEPWERLPTLNGITVGKFRKLVREQGWRVSDWNAAPILSDGRRARLPIFRLLRLAFVIPARLPILEEFFIGRICCALHKSS